MKGYHSKICNYLVSKINQKCQKKLRSTCFRCLPFSWRHSRIWWAKLLIMCAHSSEVITWIRCWGFHCLMIFTNAMSFKVLDKLHFCLEMSWNWTSFLYLAWTIFCFAICLHTKDLLPHWLSIYLVKYIKVLTISQQ